MRRKRREIVRAAIDLAWQLGTVTEGSHAERRDGSRVNVSQYAHGAAAALGLLAVYASGGSEPTVAEVIGMAVSWSDRLASDVAEHPEGVTCVTIDLRRDGADHE